MDPIDHYLNARGYEPRPETDLNAVFSDALPRFLEIFEEYGVKATFFFVGKDALDKENAARIRQLSEMGHEVANHTMNHSPNFGRMTGKEIRAEVEEAHEVLSDIIGKPVRGFRAPGWAITAECLDVLEELGYSYDSSIFPSLMASGLKMANWIMNKGRMPASLGSSWNIGSAPKLPYRPGNRTFWRRGERSLLELPPTVLPVIQFPFLGTVLYLLGKGVFSLSYRYFRLFRRALFYELHGLELVDYYTRIKDERMKVKPGVGKTIEEKVGLYRMMLNRFSRDYDYMTMHDIGEKLNENCGTDIR